MTIGSRLYPDATANVSPSLSPVEHAAKEEVAEAEHRGDIDGPEQASDFLWLQCFHRAGMTPVRVVAMGRPAPGHTGEARAGPPRRQGHRPRPPHPFRSGAGGEDRAHVSAGTLALPSARSGPGSGVEG